MNDVITIAAPVFVIIALGYACARKQMFGADAQRSFSLYVFYVCMPSYLFLNMAQGSTAALMPVAYIAAYAVSMLVVAVAAWLSLRRCATRDLASTILGMMSASYTNSAFIGIPIIVMAYGTIAPVVAVALFQILVVTTALVATIEIHRQGRRITWQHLGTIPKIVLFNPIIAGSLLGVVVAKIGWKIPHPVQRICHLLGDAGVPTALFALGLSLGGKQPVATPANRRLVHLLVALKVLVHPAVAWVVGRYCFDLTGSPLGALTLIAGMPTAMNTFTFAQRYGVFVQEASRVVFLSTCLWLITLPVLLYVFRVMP